MEDLKITRDHLLKDLEHLYHVALAQNKLSVALKAKELLGRAIGLFHFPRTPTPPLISELSSEQLEHMISSVQERLTIGNKNTERKLK